MRTDGAKNLDQSAKRGRYILATGDFNEGKRVHKDLILRDIFLHGNFKIMASTQCSRDSLNNAPLIVNM
jgi:hypothetical protein